MWSDIVSKRKRALLWVVSGPSGSGKTTLCNRLLRNKKLGIVRSVSFTTRPLRKGEKNHRDYIFVSKETFLRKIKNGDFIEWKKVFNNLYGTSKKLVDGLRAKNKDVLLSIDVKGALEIKRKFPQKSVFIFVVPPNGKELAKRIKRRAREDKEEMQRRLAFAKTELSFANEYDYIIINDVLSKAVNDLETIIIARRLENVLRATRKYYR